MTPTAGEDLLRRARGRGPGVVAIILSAVVLHFVFIAPAATGAVLPSYGYLVAVPETERVLEIRGRCDDTHAVTISVQDHGAGLDPARVERLFEAFYTTKAHGMGMGLAISRSIIELHEGRLWAESNQGRGATFSFSVPAVGRV